jgi:N-acetylmuramic acid 6-phosphate etherase
VVLYGGVFEQSERYFDLVKGEILRHMPTARVVRPGVEGAVAAARLARERAALRKDSAELPSSSVSVPVTESRNWRSTQIDSVSTKEMLEIINIEDRKVAHVVEQVLDDVARAVDAAAEAISSGGRVFYVGTGTSGRLGVLDAAECPPTFGVPPEMFQAIIAGGSSALRTASEVAEDDVQAGVEEIAHRAIGRNDLVVGISSSGTTPFVKSALDEARKRGARTVLVACNPATAEFPSVDILITPVVGSEVIAGSTRMKAGTATKMVLNMISTGAMIKLGKVYGNLMIDVQPRSSKLVIRARRILQEITGIEDEEAAELMKQSGNDLKVAIIMKKLSVSSDEAVAILAGCHGNLRQALEMERG